MPTRRHFLQTLVAATLASSLPLPRPALATTESPASTPERIPWRNWSGLQTAYPKHRLAPANTSDLQQILRDSEGVIRPVGAGHSFTALMNTEDTLLSLDRLSGLTEYDETLHQATFMAGTRLSDTGQTLEDIGQALPNMPDIDSQTLAGSMATATHGTGQGLGCMSAYAVELEMATAEGELVRCSADHNPELFQAACVGLGSLGVLTRVRLQNQPAYRLEKRLEWWPIEEILAQALTLAEKHRNFEFFYVPFSGMGFVDIQDITDAPVQQSGDRLDQNDGAYDLMRARDWLSWSPRLRQLILGGYMRTLADEHTVASSWQTYSHDRAVRFNEMEYHLPVEAGLAAFREIRQRIEQDFPEVFFPLEVRFVQSDTLWLSPFYQRESLSIAVHRYFEEDHLPLFRAIEPILRRYGGRPHWGKWHSLSGSQLAALYPRWKDFLAVREEMDPQGRFLNPYLRQLFALES